MSNTSNLDLERPDKGDTEWHTSLNSNMTKLDTGYGNNVATIADLPQMYIETGTFNYTTGDTITLPVAVDATNEYSVEITPTSRAGAIGDIYVTKATTNFIVKCSENNTTDTFEAVIYYLGDIASYGGSIYRRWYVSPDAAITDHGDDTDTGSLAWVLDQIGATPSTVELPGNKAYVISTTLVVASNIHLIFQKEAILTDDGSNADLTINGTITAGLYQIFDWGNGTGDLTFGEGMSNEYFPQWTGAFVNGVGNDLIAVQRIADSMTSGVLRLTAGDWTFTTMAAYTSANTGSLNGQLIIANPISIKGDGRDHTIITSTLDDTYLSSIVINGVNGGTIEDIAIIGTGAAYSSNYGGGIRVELSSRITIKNCHFEDLRGIAINFNGNAGTAAGDTDVANYCTYGVCDGNVIRDCNGDGIYHIFSKYNSTVNNIIIGTGYTDAIIYEASDTSTIANNVIKNPQVRSILVNTGSDRCTVTGNAISHYDAATVHDSIYLASVHHCVVSNNTIEYVAAGGVSPKSGIVMVPGSYSTSNTYHVISNNSIKNAGGSFDITAIHVQTFYNLIEGNFIEEGSYGISVDAGDYNVLRGNYIKTTAQAIRLAGIDGRDDPNYTQVIGNYIVTDVYEAGGTGNVWKDNLPMVKIGTATSNQMFNSVTKHYSSASLDSSGGAITFYINDGSYIGQICTVSMADATASSTVYVVHHRANGGAEYVGTFDAVDEAWTLVWTGTEWDTLGTPTCTFV